MEKFLMRYWLEAGFSIVLAFITWESQRVWRNIKKECAEQRQLKEGVVSILSDRLWQLGKHLEALDIISIDDMANWRQLYKGYEGLDGNGKIALLNEVLEKKYDNQIFAQPKKL